MRKCNHDANGQHISHQVARRQAQVCQMMQTHLCEIWVSLIQEKVTDRLLQRPSKLDQTNHVDLLVHGCEWHRDETVCKSACTAHEVPGLPVLATDAVPVSCTHHGVIDDHPAAMCAFNSFKL